MKNCRHRPTRSSARGPASLLALVGALVAVGAGVVPMSVVAGEIIVAPAPSSSSTAQGARDARQRAVVEGSRNRDGELPMPTGPVIIIEGVPSPTGSPAGNSAAYNRTRANASRQKNEDVPFGQVPTQLPVQIPGQVILGTGVETPNSQQTPEGRAAEGNRQRANVYRHRKKED